MAVAGSKKTKATIVRKSALDHAGTFLDELPEKPKESLSLREAVNQLREPLLATLAKGYNYEELAEFLSDKGIGISPATLKNYLPSGKRKSSKEETTTPKTGRRGKQSGDSSATSTTAKKTDESELSNATASTSANSSEDTAALTKRRPRGTAAKAKTEAGATAKPTAATRARKTAKKDTPTKSTRRPTSTIRGRKKASS